MLLIYSYVQTFISVRKATSNDEPIVELTDTLKRMGLDVDAKKVKKAIDEYNIPIGRFEVAATVIVRSTTNTTRENTKKSLVPFPDIMLRLKI